MASPRPGSNLERRSVLSNFRRSYNFAKNRQPHPSTSSHARPATPLCARSSMQSPAAHRPHARVTQHIPKLDPDCACPAGASAWPSRHRGLRKLRAPAALIGKSLIALSDISSDLRTMTNAVPTPASRTRQGEDQVAFWPCSARTIGFRPLRGRNPKRGRNADVAADPAAPTGSAGQLDRPAPQTSLWGTEQDC